MTEKNSPVVDPELEPFLSALKTMPSGVPELREFLKTLTASAGLHPDAKEQFVPAPEGHSIRVLIFGGDRKEAGPGFLYIHGGAFVAGVAEMGQDWCVEAASQLGATVVSIDYRLAPETVHPGQVEDCYTVLKWMYDNAEELAIDRDRIGVGGGSAGGCLTAGVTLLARDRGEIPVAFQRIVAGTLDDRIECTRDPERFFGISWDDVQFAWRSLLGHEPGGPDVSCYAAPARASDLSGLPPTFIAVGELDPLMEQNVAYACQLAQANVQVELHVYPRAFHGFEITKARISQQMRATDLAAAKRALID